MSATYTFEPLVPERWDDFQTLFGPRGAIGGCWCMWWRIKRSEFSQQQGEGNRQTMQSIVNGGEVPGLLAYQESESGPTATIGWVSVAPREAFPVLDRSWVLKRVDDQPVWSIVCFFIDKSYRGQGLSSALIQAALDYAAQNGAQIVEAYPEDPAEGESQNPFLFTGVARVFEDLGFKEVARRSPKRPVMRFYINDQKE